jgi:predicted metallopeptidase
MVCRIAELGHIDMTRVAVSFCQARKLGRFGIYATLTPLRFAGGQTQTIRRGRPWIIQRLYDAAGREMLYILSFYLPRYLDLPLREKLKTVVHELWHISPAFDGDLRRFGGRCHFHTSSKREYDAHAHRLVDDYLASAPDPALYEFLRDGYQALHARHGRIYGTKVPAPKLLPLEGPS